ncbi:folate family ECF transporter S component [Tetragenococcus koreensis]|uniref:Folate family ECF transporter S component n=1 Tax=Tetragenococcus koreensis TaxID=290335 RepID=A0AAN4ZNR0_9ENTE|nr:folate family ECF transporter S component [Tetragenococcus koreensis]GEQ49639.1 hypothetical protein TK11N_14910 [Tetragenococcus koreensis]GEQ52085.1 hypothetical protein TK12N_14290 [Tetragenococcus koreensis]GEQ54620.1 hypothetical protein TK2N_14640 [Tetragenococcus koreensis]GEQ57100.1 hypothetical protein TK4N_14430 [Tetragenococcus koreensis]GEQ59652.1 hypothetical protein TK6N_14910 [Tetragenococcus koreensis]
MIKKLTTQSLAIMGFLIALMVVLSQVLGFETQLLKITFDFIPEVMMASLFGPWWTAIGAAIADIIGNTLLGKAPFFIGFTINALIGGTIYGFFFYRKKITLKNTFLCVSLNTIIISLFLTPLWLSIMYNIPFTDKTLWVLRIVKALIMIPIQTGFIVIFGKAIPIKFFSKYAI